MWDPGTRRKRDKVGRAAIKTISAKVHPTLLLAFSHDSFLQDSESLQVKSKDEITTHCKCKSLQDPFSSATTPNDIILDIF